MIQVVLSAAHCSGRGVRLALLSPDECDRVMLMAAKELGESGTMLELRKKEARDGVCVMVKAVTKETNLDQESVLKATWVEVTPAVLSDPEQFTKYFNAKDAVILDNLYRRYHEASVDEIDKIMGKALSTVD